jgi:outer membrane immunogenic protein
MRLLVRGLLLACAASPAFAGDIDNSWLRGSSGFPADPPPFQRWSGFYGGGQVSADFHGISFNDDGNSTLSNFRSGDAVLGAVPMNSLLPLGSLSTRGLSYGGFVGYNYQLDDVVLGFELNFNQANSTSSASQSQTATPGQLANGTITQNGLTTTTNCATCYGPPVGTPGFATATSSVLYIPGAVTESNTVTATLQNYGEARIRGGWAFGDFLPYVTVGLSVARIDSTETVYAHYVGTGVTTTTTSTVPNPQTTPASAPYITVSTPVAGPVNRTYVAGETTSGKYSFGFAAGVGLDYALSRNVFVRGEVEYLQFSTPNNISLNTATARVGAGLKF